MTCLLYAIVASGPAGGPAQAMPSALPPGVGGGRVRVVEGDGLGAVVSTIDRRELVPTGERALAYGRVVAAFHAERPVIPMRYGCAFEHEAQVTALLRDRHAEYSESLRLLEGCVEFGVRVLLIRPALEPAVAPDPGRRGVGTAYLLGRAGVHAGAERLAQDASTWVERILFAFAGRYVLFRSDTPRHAPTQPEGGHLVSVHFLVREVEVAAFRRAFEAFRSGEGTPLLLTGPWPPYNFAAPDHERPG